MDGRDFLYKPLEFGFFLGVNPVRVKLITQNRKEYDDGKLFDTLSDPEVWRMLTKRTRQRLQA